MNYSPIWELTSWVVTLSIGINENTCIGNPSSSCDGMISVSRLHDNSNAQFKWLNCLFAGLTLQFFIKYTFPN